VNYSDEGNEFEQLPLDGIIDEVWNLSLKERKDLAEAILTSLSEDGWEIEAFPDGSVAVSKTETL
jgi:hypothetical protein